MNTKLATAILSLVAVVVGGLFAVRRKNNQKFIQQIQSLFAAADNVSAKTFSYEQLEGLSQPVQRYFRFALPDGYPYISSLRLRHGGQFKTGIDQDWISIEGEEYFTSQPPGFIWRGKTSLFTAIDRYLAGHGRLVVRLLSLIKVASASGAETDQGELLRWLGEAVWFPTRLLPSENLKWSALTEDTAQLTLTQGDFRLALRFTLLRVGKLSGWKPNATFLPNGWKPG